MWRLDPIFSGLHMLICVKMNVCTWCYLFYYENRRSYLYYVNNNIRCICVLKEEYMIILSWAGISVGQTPESQWRCCDRQPHLVGSFFMSSCVSDMTVPSCSTNKYGELSRKLTFIVISKCFVTKNVCGTAMFMLLLKSWLHYPLKFIFIVVSKRFLQRMSARQL
jgi:hypothetical protein